MPIGKAYLQLRTLLAATLLLLVLPVAARANTVDTIPLAGPTQGTGTADGVSNYGFTLSLFSSFAQNFDFALDAGGLAVDPSFRYRFGGVFPGYPGPQTGSSRIYVDSDTSSPRLDAVSTDGNQSPPTFSHLMTPKAAAKESVNLLLLITGMFGLLGLLSRPA